jgi:GT2 family glycosyltransferase/glycosyltransferase involved in cell wall biosynthesis
MTASEQPVLLITGMHRSGTSLAASVFQSAGLFIGERLMGPAESNVPGHFEDLDFVALHERMLAAAGLCPTGLVAPVEPPPVAESLRDAAQALIAKRRATGRPWGWKDPRTVLFLDFWDALLPKAGWLFICRGPWAVVDSLFRRGDAVFRDNPALALEVWRHFNGRILDFVGRHPERAMVVDVSQIVADSPAVVARVAGHFRVGLADPAATVREELLTTRGAERHVAAIRAACPEACGLYDDVRRLAGLPASEAAGSGGDPGLAALVEWGRATEADRRALALDRDLQATLGQAASLEAALEASRGEAEAVRRESQEAITDGERRQEELRQERLAAVERHREVEARAFELERLLAERDARTAALAAERDAAGERLVAAERQAAAAEERAAEAEQQAAAAAQQARSAKQQTETADQRAVAAERLAEGADERARTAERQAAETAEVMERLRRQLADREAALRAVAQTATERAEQLVRLTTEGEALKHNRDRIEAQHRDSIGLVSRLRSTVEEHRLAAENQAREAAGLRERLASREQEKAGLSAALEAAQARVRALEGELRWRSEAVSRAESACRAEAERCRQLMASNSMRLTSPLREARRWLSDPGGRAGHCSSAIMSGVRGLYDTLPFDPRTRLRHRQFLAARFPWVLLASGSPAETIAGLARAPAALVLLPPPAPASPVEQAVGRQQALGWEPIHLPQHDQPVVSIIVPVHNQWAFTHACLRSIVAAEPDLPCEVILADDASSDETTAADRLVPGLVIQRNPQPLGFLRNCNTAARRARGDHLLFLNNDTQVQPGAISALLDVFRTHPDAGLAGAKLVYPDGRLQEAGGILWADGSAWNYGRGQDPTLPEFNYLRETDYCSGAALLVPRRLFERLGGFDDRYAPAYCEDSDLAFAIRAAGRKVYYQPEAVVVHHEGASHGTDTGQGLKAHQVLNQRRFREKWRETLERENFPNGQDVFHARDRSAGKPCILVIDHYIPQPDRDAGSRTMWCFLRLFTRMGLNVKFWPQNLYHDPVYARPLEAAGIEIMYGPRFVDRFPDWVREHGGRLDYVLLSRPHVASEFLEPLRRHSQARLLYYGHDLHHARLAREAELKGDPVLAKQAEAIREVEESVWRQVDAVYYPSAEETAAVAARCQTPTRTVPAYFFDDLAAEPPPAAGRQGICFVAGFAHPPNVDAAEWLVAEIMPLVWQAAPETRLWLVGSNPNPAVQALAGDRVAVTGYVTDQRLAAFYRAARLAVVPLRFGAGVKNKVIEALHHGLPLVTTPVGAQGLEGIERILPVAADPATLARRILELLRDDRRWEATAAAGRSFVADRFSAAGMWRAFAADITLPEGATPEPTP